MVCYWFRRLRHVRRREHLYGRADERRSTRQHFVRHHAERVDVGAQVRRGIGRYLLGRHVDGRAVRHAGGRDLLAAGSFTHRLGDSEVCHDRVLTTQEHVVGFDVPMDDSLGVCLGKGVRHVTEDSYGISQRQLVFAGELAAQRLTVHERHHVVQKAGGLAGIDERQDVRMLQVRGDLDLPQESRSTDDRRELGNAAL